MSSAEPLLEHATKLGIAFIPWFPLATGKLASSGGPLDKLAQKHRATPSQLALVWLLKRSRVTLPIPGTLSLKHLEENEWDRARDRRRARPRTPAPTTGWLIRELAQMTASCCVCWRCCALVKRPSSPSRRSR